MFLFILPLENILTTLATFFFFLNFNPHLATTSTNFLLRVKREPITEHVQLI